MVMKNELDALYAGFMHLSTLDVEVSARPYRFLAEIVIGQIRDKLGSGREGGEVANDR